MLRSLLGFRNLLGAFAENGRDVVAWVALDDHIIAFWSELQRGIRLQDADLGVIPSDEKVELAEETGTS